MGYLDFVVFLLPMSFDCVVDVVCNSDARGDDDDDVDSNIESSSLSGWNYQKILNHKHYNDYSFSIANFRQVALENHQQ